MDWNIAGFNVHNSTISKLLDFQKELKTPFLKYVFGSIPSKVSGGRFSTGYFDFDKFKSDVSYFNFVGIGVRLTFSSTLISEDDLQEPAMNKALSYLNRLNFILKAENGVIVCSDILLNYIRENYKYLKIISSLVRVAKDTNFISDGIDYYSQLLGKYDLVVINQSKAFEEDFLKKLPYKEKVEFIANTRCIKNCPYAAQHYILVSKINRGIDVSDSLVDCNVLTCKCREIYQEKESSHCQFSLDDISRLQNLGFEHFKLEGRDFSEEAFLKDVEKYLQVRLE